ncbi:hypothetical protein AV530_016965 [Patagioenas fasciata monilis]|uniref:Uncharacterized protein n=1 Tax=Patagioenas fasciata monilis TaxID=372326 RepID=A0A1V4J4B1_PATFA|nr:hypothetical protein AV530_016965 [Patagioenas fasciata monilis]
MVKTMVRLAVPLQPMEFHGGSEIPLLFPEDPMLVQVDASEGSCDSVGSLCSSKLLAEPVIHEERSPHGSRFAGRINDLMEDPRWTSLFLKDCTLWKGLTLGQFMKTEANRKDPRWRSSWRTVYHGRDPMLEQGKRVRIAPLEEEGAAETTCDKLLAIPIPCPPSLLGGRENRG